MLLEVCVDNLESVAHCAEAGVRRIELCAGLVEGGTTPTAGILARARALHPDIIHAMLRPRGGDFLYAEEELRAMELDLELLADAGAQGVVFGCLDADGRLDPEANGRLLNRARGRGLATVLHRAFDLSRDLGEALEDAIELGFGRILTSGGATSAPAGAETLAGLVRRANGRITLMAGGGVRPGNVAELVARSGVAEIHASCRALAQSPMRFRREDLAMGAATVPDEFQRPAADPAQIAALLTALGGD